MAKGQQPGSKTDANPRSSVAPPPAKNVAILVLGVISMLFMGYKFLFSGSDKNVEDKAKETLNLADTNPVNQLEPTVITITPAPEPTPPPPAPTLEIAPPPPPAPPIVAEIAPPPPPAASQQPQVDPKEQRKRAGIMVSGNGVGGGSTEMEFRFYGGAPLKKTGFDQAEATAVGDLTRIIAQGKMIEAVLETAINTDHPGVLRAIVSRDVFAEKGSAILIPRGTRLIGEYGAEIKRGQSRVYVSWNRLIRADGVDIAVKSPGTDPLGRSGLHGIVDSKYLELFGNALLLTTINTAVTYGLEKATKSKGVSERQYNDGSSQRSGKASDYAAQDSVTRMGQVGNTVAGDFMAVVPTITIDQGTKISVFVNRDLIFPHGTNAALVIR